MLRELAEQLTPGYADDAELPVALFERHPTQITRWLEALFAQVPDAGPWTLPIPLRNELQFSLALNQPNANREPRRFHLIYAYLVESTGAYEVLAEVVRRFAVGEVLRTVDTDPARTWLRNTEELFFRDPPLFSATSVVSSLRPDQRVNRRNAYWRMFGMDLPHQVPGLITADQPWKRNTGPVNTDFRTVWAEFLGQVWIGLLNQRNQAGANPTDSSSIGILAARLEDMLSARRQGLALLREEFAYVATMSWFHLTLETNTGIVRELKAASSTPSERLLKIGEQVGIRPAPYIKEVLILADDVAWLLRRIEDRDFRVDANVQRLYDETIANNTDPARMRRIINHWQLVTGERVKDLAVRTTDQATARPTLPLATSTNGSRANGKTAARV
jgi:hypothetical protein